MPESPEGTSNFARVPTPAARKLAERYGITPEAVEEIISGTAREYEPTPSAATPVSDPNKETFAPLTLPPVPESQIPIERVAAVEPPLRKVPLQDPVRTVPTNVPTTKKPGSSPLSGGVITAIIISLLVLLGIAISFQRGCFRQRQQPVERAPVDTVQSLLNDAAQKASEPPIAPSDVKPPQVPPEALATPREAPVGTTGKQSPVTKPSVQTPVKKSRTQSSTRTRSTRAPLLTTSSNLEAQERLAELRASGQRSAHLKVTTKNGQRVYQVIR